MSLEQSLSHVNSLPRYIKLLTFSIACPSIFTLASFSSGFFQRPWLCLYYIYMHCISCTFCMQFVDCILQFLIALFNNINVVSKSEVVHSITMNTYSTVFYILDCIHYSVQEQSKWPWWQWIDSLSIVRDRNSGIYGFSVLLDVINSTYCHTLRSQQGCLHFHELRHVTNCVITSQKRSRPNSIPWNKNKISTLMKDTI